MRTKKGYKATIYPHTFTESHDSKAVDECSRASEKQTKPHL